MKLCHVNIVLLLIIMTSNKAMVNGDKEGSGASENALGKGSSTENYPNCTEEYPVSYHGQEIHSKYIIKIVQSPNATAGDCQRYCTADAKCKSVMHIEGVKYNKCVKYNVGLQELIVTGRKYEIYNYSITYDRNCTVHYPNCTKEYPVLHHGQGIVIKKYIISITWLNDHDDIAKDCQDLCSADDLCKSVTYIGAINRKAGCVKNNVGLQELIDTGREKQIYNFSIFITYDRKCSVHYPNCTEEYPVTYHRQEIHSKYIINITQNRYVTAEDCQEWCSADDWCKSVMYQGGAIYGIGLCIKYNVGVQELIVTGRKNEIYNYSTLITYDRNCTENYPNCTEEYPVSHNWQGIHSKYTINPIGQSPNATAEDCQRFCSDDARCKSVMYIEGEEYNKCEKYNVGLQELIDTGRKNVTFNISRPITYDRDCAETFPNCTSIYHQVSNDGEAPEKKYKIGLFYNGTAAICQTNCSDDSRCKSVVYWSPYRMCFQYNVSLQELRNTSGKNEIYKFPRHITYDRDCE